MPLGPNVNGFEKDLEEFVNKRGRRASSQEGLALSAGTAAVHIALIACGVKADDKVLVQSFTFCASSHPVTYLGGALICPDADKSREIYPYYQHEAIGYN